MESIFDWSIILSIVGILVVVTNIITQVLKKLTWDKLPTNILAALIARFFDPQSGKISIGGANVKDIDKSELMDTVSFVFQNSRLIKGSILDSVRRGKPNATDGEVLAALSAVLTIIGPDQVGKIATIMSDGLLGGIDLAAIARVGILLAVIYGLRFCATLGTV